MSPIRAKRWIYSWPHIGHTSLGYDYLNGRLVPRRDRLVTNTFLKKRAWNFYEEQEMEYDKTCSFFNPVYRLNKKWAILHSWFSSRSWHFLTRQNVPSWNDNLNDGSPLWSSSAVSGAVSVNRSKSGQREVWNANGSTAQNMPNFRKINTIFHVFLSWPVSGGEMYCLVDNGSK